MGHQTPSRRILRMRDICLKMGISVELQRKVSHYLQPILSHQFLNNLA